jgi:tetratricopeptide (TPR) repeat protein
MRVFVLAILLSLPAAASAQVRLPKGQEEINQASAMIVRGDYAGAEPLLRRALAVAPNEPYAHFNMATVLRATGRNADAIAEYQQARRLFETVRPGANGAGDIGNCLYGIALAHEADGDAAAAARAWQSYVSFARGVDSEQAAVAIAQDRLRTDRQLAQSRARPPGTQEAKRPGTIR